MNSREMGNVAEEKAASYLVNNGYEIVERNYYILGGEIDIIAKKDDTIIFFEVKSTSFNKYNFVAQKVPVSKKRKIMKSAKMYLKKNNINPFDTGLQFDLLFYVGDEIRHIENFIQENEV